MYKLIKLYFSSTQYPLKNLYLMIFILMTAFNSQSINASNSVAQPVVSALTASPNSSQANTSTPTQLQISDLAKIQQQILHLEFLKKLALTHPQPLPVTVASSIQNKPAPLAPEKNTAKRARVENPPAVTMKETMKTRGDDEGDYENEGRRWRRRQNEGRR